MKWNKIKDCDPPLKSKLLIWRFKNKKYTIATANLISRDEDGTLTEEIEWVTEHNTCHPINPEDHFMFFPPLEVTHIYQ
jgi:hypothetical protein